MEENQSKTKLAWKMLPMKYKLIIIGIILGIFSLILFFVVLTAPLMKLGVIDATAYGVDLSPEYSDISSGLSFWWPIGSTKTTPENGTLFAKGEPEETEITSGFGYRDISDEVEGASKNHQAIDIGNLTGANGVTNIIASEDGKVIEINTGCTANKSCNSGLGNYVKIEHSDGIITRYGHLYSVSVSKDENVKQGQVIGKMGTTGISGGIHLDFQVIVNGTPVNPLNYVSMDNPRPEKIKNTPVIGESNVQTVCLTLKNYGYNDTAVAAIMGNIENESGYLPINTNSIGCDGIVQWCFGRLTNLKSTYGNHWTSIDNQLEFVNFEIQNDSDINNYLKGNNSAEDKAYYFCMNYEIPGESICASGKRQNSAKTRLKYIQNGCK